MQDKGGGVYLQQRGPVLVLRDAASWGRTLEEDILSAAGVLFDVRTSAQLTANPNLVYGYKRVVIPGDQTNAFYTAVQAQNVTLGQYVQRGGWLVYLAAVCGWNGGGCGGISLPFGVTVAHRLDNTNNVVLPAHRLVAGVPNPFTGTSASHGRIGGSGFTVVTTEASFADNGPTLVVRDLPSGGRMIVSTQPLEYACWRLQGGQAIFENTYEWVVERFVGPVGLNEFCETGATAARASAGRSSTGR